MISVIIPTYNRASNIKRAMLSVLGQSYSDIELIVIDDGSTDDTEVVVNSISDSRVRYYRQEKQGACAARNLGIHLAKGDYIAFQDSDDEWLENKLEKQIQYMEKTGADLAAHAFTRFSFKKEGTVERIPDAEYPSGRVQYAELVTGNFCSTQTLMVKKVCFNEELFDITYPRLQDWELVLRLSEKWKLYFDNEVYANVYVQKNSISRDMNAYYVAIDKMYWPLAQRYRSEHERYIEIQKEADDLRSLAEQSQKEADVLRNIVQQRQKEADAWRETVQRTKAEYENAFFWKLSAPIRSALDRVKRIYRKDK